MSLASILPGMDATAAYVTGRLKPPAVAPPPPPPPAPLPVALYWQSRAEAAAQRHGIDPTYFVAQIGAESGWSEDVVTGKRRSSAGALGIAQFMPATAAQYGIDPLNPEEALDGAARYMADNLRAFGGDARAAAAAYNAGAGRVADLQRQHGAGWESGLPGETRQYLARIFGTATATAAAPNARLAPAPEYAEQARGTTATAEARAPRAWTIEQDPERRAVIEEQTKSLAPEQRDIALQVYEGSLAEGAAPAEAFKRMTISKRSFSEGAPEVTEEDLAGLDEAARQYVAEHGYTQEALREALGNARGVGELSRPLGKGPAGLLDAAGRPFNMAGEALATVADPAIGLLPEGARAPVRRAVELAPSFAVGPGGIAKSALRRSAASVAGLSAAATAAGEVAEKLGVGRGVGELLGPLVGGAAAGSIRLRGRGPVLSATENLGGKDRRVFKQGDTTRRTGLPPGIETDEDIAALMDRLKETAKAGKIGRYFYENTGAEINRLTQGDREAGDLLARVVALTSVDTSVASQAPFILRAWGQMATGQDIKGLRYKPVVKMVDNAMRADRDTWDQTIIRWLSGKDEGKTKLANFYLDILEEVDFEHGAALRAASGGTVTIDRWMNRAFKFRTDARTPDQYKFMAETVLDIADQLEWTPKQVQAAMWASERHGAIEAGSKTARGLEYGPALRDNVAQIRWESAPAAGTDREAVLRGVVDRVSPEDRNLHHYRVAKAFLDDDGADMLAKVLRLPYVGEFSGPAPRQGKVTPGSQTLTLAGLGNKSKHLDAGMKELISTYAAARGIILRQDKVAWTRPLYTTKVAERNGMAVHIGRTVNDEEASSLSLALGDSYAVVPTPEGVWLFNTEGSLDAKTNKAARATMLDATKRLWDASPVTVEVRNFASDGDIISNDWTVNPDGASYRQGRSALDRPDVREVIVSLQRRVDEADQLLLRQYANPREERGLRGGTIAGARGPGGRAPFGEPDPGLAGGGQPPTAAPRAEPPAPGLKGTPAPPAVKARVVGPEEAAALPGPEFARNIRLSMYPAEARHMVRDWALENEDAIVVARRGTRTVATTTEDARKLVEEMGGDFQKLQRNWKPGQAWNADEVTAIRGTLLSKTKQVMAAAEAVRADDSTKNHASLLLALQEQALVQGIVHGVTAEAGRTLASFRNAVTEFAKAGDAERMQELLKRLGGPGATPAKLQELAANIAALDTSDPVKVNNFLRNAAKPKLWDYLTELWINSVLSGPKTHIVNALSNTMNLASSPVERGLAAGVETVLAPLQGRRRERFFDEVPADVAGAAMGIPEGLRAALYTLKNGITPTQASKWEFRETAFKGRLGRIIRAPGTALEAADALNYEINYSAAFNAGIVRQVAREGLSGSRRVARIAELKAEPTVALMKQAQETANYRLFRSPPGTLTKAVMAARDAFPPLRFVLPFLQTPSNLLKFGIERSPLGLINPTLWRNLANKSPEASDQIARVLMGSSVAALVAWQFADGKITGAAPKKIAERDRFFREGKLPYAVKVGDKWVQYQRLEPFNQVLSQVAGVVDALQNGDTDVVGKVEQAVASIGTNLVSQTYLTGLNNLIDAISRPDQYGPSFVNRIAGGFIPASSALRTTAQVQDPVFRQPGGLGETLMAGIPGLSESVPGRLNAFGEVVPRTSPAVSPIQVTSETQSALDRELATHGIEVPFAGKTLGGEELPRGEQRAYQILVGQTTKRVLEDTISRQSYRRASAIGQEVMLDRAISVVGSMVRESLDPESGGDRGNLLRAEDGKLVEQLAKRAVKYFDLAEDRVKLGYDLYDPTTGKVKGNPEADSVALDKANPRTDVANWYFSTKSRPQTLQTAEAVDLAMRDNPDGRDVKLSWLTRPVNESVGSEAAWEYAKKPLAWYNGELIEANKEAERLRLARQNSDYNKPWEKLEPSQRAAITGNLRETARKQSPELDAFLVWWGEGKLHSKAAGAIFEQIMKRYGSSPPSKDFKVEYTVDAR